MLTIKGRYRVVDTVATRPEAVVYLAEDLTRSRPVALTVLSGEAAADADFVAAVREQAFRLAKPLSAHRALPAVHDCDTTDEGDLFVAADPVEGRSLREALAERGAFSPPEALRLAIQIGEALETLHRNGMVHGDLQPESVVLDKDDDGTEGVRLVGLELASARQTALGRRLREAAAEPYLSPEQLELGESSEASDVYALGLLLRELLTAEPSSGTGPRGHAAGELPPPLARIVGKALESRPERRYSSMSLLVNDLWSAQPEPAKATPSPVTQVLTQRRASARRRARSDLGMAVALVVGLVLVGVTAWVVSSERLAGAQRTDGVELPVAASPVSAPAARPSVNALTAPHPAPALPAPVEIILPPAEPARRSSAATPPEPAVTPREAAATPRPPAAAKPDKVVATPAPRPSRAGADERGADGDGSAIIDWLLKGPARP